MKNSKVIRRKTSGLIAKNLIILLVLAVVAFLAIWAWFSKNTSATADGISLKAKADGVEVSWDGKSYYKNLTAMSDDEVEAAVTGLAKNLTDSDQPSPLSLITGNGLSFFEPKLNRRTGVPLKNSDGSWQGTAVDSSNSSGRYIDIDLYFRGTTQRDVYLASDSVVSPKETSAISEYGAFSTGYICSASRLAFLNDEKTSCSFIWAPNSNYELKESSGYSLVDDEQTAEIVTPGTSTIGEYLTNSNGKTYYLWLPNNYDSDPNSQQDFGSHKMEFEVFDNTSGTGLYTFEFTMNLNSYKETRDIPLTINNSSSSFSASDANNCVDISASWDANGSDSAPMAKISNQTFNNINGIQMPKFYIDKFYGTNDFKIKLGYNPNTKILLVVGYSGTTPSGGTKNYDRAGTSSSTEYKYYYELESDASVALASPEHALALTSADSSMLKAISFKDSNTISPSSISLTEQFTVKKTVEDAEKPYEATYKFKNLSNDKFLTVSDGNLSYTSAGTEFTLDNLSSFEGPAICFEDYYLVVKNGSLQVVNYSNLNLNDLVTVYTGDSYELDTNSSNSQTYIYYDNTAKETKALNTGSVPPLYATIAYDTVKKPEVTKVGVPVATLTKPEKTDDADEGNEADEDDKNKDDDEYYKAHIVIRVWVEGTDRDALMPLANGIFNMSLHFTAK